jgi:hypothetical protein
MLELFPKFNFRTKHPRPRPPGVQYSLPTVGRNCPVDLSLAYPRVSSRCFHKTEYGVGGKDDGEGVLKEGKEEEEGGGEVSTGSTDMSFTAFTTSFPDDLPSWYREEASRRQGVLR